MKNLTQFLIENEQTYEFKIKIAGIELDNNALDRIEHALDAFQLCKLSKPKRLPISEVNLDFPQIPNCEVSLLIASLSYPCTDEQLRTTIATQGRFPLASIVVVPKNHPEELRRDSEAEEEGKDKKALLDTELEQISGGQEQVGKQRADSLLRDLESRKTEFASTPEAPAKTTNDLPMGTTSPISGRKGSK